MKWLLPVPEGPQTTRLRRGRPTPGCAARSGSALGSRRVGFPGVEGLAGRQPGGLAAHRDGRVVAAGGLLGEQHAQHFGGLPALAGGGRDHIRRRAANIGQPQPAQSRSSSSGSGGGGGVVTVIGRTRPTPGWSAAASCSRPAGNSSELTAARPVLVGEHPGEVAVSEPARAERRSPAPGSRRSGAVELGQIDRLGHLAPHRCVPAAAASTSQPSAAGPIVRNACSSLGCARGRRCSAPGGLGG